MSDAPHIPVLGREAIEHLAPREGGIYVDATFGAGGYSRAILDVARATKRRLPAVPSWSRAPRAG
jgi:16S rRNA C1402 N4-methylase RsmH